MWFLLAIYLLLILYIIFTILRAKKDLKKTIRQNKLIIGYADEVGQCGPDSPRALKMKRENANNKDFLSFASGMDGLYWALRKNKKHD